MARGGCRIENRSRNYWGVIIGVIVLTFASVLFGQSDTTKGLGAPSGSTYATDSFGLSAIYAVLDRENMALRWERAPERLRSDVDKLVIWQPGPMKDGVWDVLEDWVAEGHTLILGETGYHYPGDILFTEAQSGTAFSASAHPATVGVTSVSVGSGTLNNLPDAPLVHLVRPNGKPVLVSWAHGRGRIYWSADYEWLENRRIASDSNLELAVNLLVPAEGKVTAFDEYHHGFRAADRWWQLLRGPLQNFVLQLNVAIVILFWAYGVRFGAPLALPPVPPRAAVEYVYSMSQLYRRARARKVVTQSLYRSLTRELSRLLGGLGTMSHTEIARRTAERTGLPAHTVEHALERTSPQAARTPTDNELILLSREVEAIQRSVHNAGYRDQHHTGTGAK